MPVLVLIIFGLFGAALIAGLIFLVAFFGHALMTGQAQHMNFDYIRAVAVFALEASLAHALLLGTPAFMGLYRLGWLKSWVCLLAGLAIGTVPTAIRSWPWHPAVAAGSKVTISVLRGGKLVQTVVNGVPTLAGWLDYAWNVLTYSALGALGGLAFWLLWQILHPVLQRMPTRR